MEKKLISSFKTHYTKKTKEKRGEEDQTTRKKRKRHRFQACFWINLSPELSGF